MNNENLSNQESLELISKMISTAKGNVGQGAFHMLLWGWVVMIVSAAHFVLLKFQLIAHPEAVWLLTIPTFFVSFYVGYKKGKKARVKTHLDRVYAWVWMAFTVTFLITFVLVMGKWDIINPMILTLAGYATFLSGVLLKFRPMIYGAIGFWIWAIIAYVAGPLYGILVTSAAICTGYLIPGYLLKMKTDES
jgi:hypothetical protein